MKVVLIALLMIVSIAADEETVDDQAIDQAMGAFFDLQVDLSIELTNTEEHPLRDIELFLRSELPKKPYLQARELGQVTRIQAQVV